MLLAAMETVVATAVPLRPIVYVPEELAVLVTRMLVTTVVVDAGTVYSVVPTVVVAAPRNKTFAVFGIRLVLPLLLGHCYR